MFTMRVTWSDKRWQCCSCQTLLFGEGKKSLKITNYIRHLESEGLQSTPVLTYWFQLSQWSKTDERQAPVLILLFACEIKLPYKCFSQRKVATNGTPIVLLSASTDEVSHPISHTCLRCWEECLLWSWHLWTGVQSQHWYVCWETTDGMRAMNGNRFPSFQAH